MSDIEDGVTIIPMGKPCWGCVDLIVEKIPMVGEDFYCTQWSPPMLIGRIRKIMDGCVVPREMIKTNDIIKVEGCYRGRG